MKFNSSLLFWILKIGVLLVTGKMTYQFSNAWFYGDWFVVYGLLIVVNIGEYFAARAAVLASQGAAKFFFAVITVMAAGISIMGSYGYMLIADELSKLAEQQLALEQARQVQYAEREQTAAQLAGQAMEQVEGLPGNYKSKRAKTALSVLEAYSKAVSQDTVKSTLTGANRPATEQLAAAMVVNGLGTAVANLTTMSQENAKTGIVLFIALFIELQVIGVAVFEALDDRNTGQQLGLEDNGTRHLVQGQRLQITPETLALLGQHSNMPTGAKLDSAVTVTHEVELLIKEFTEDKDFEDPFFNPIRAQQTLELCYHLRDGDKIPWSKIAGIVGVKPQSVQNLWKRYQAWLEGREVVVNR